MGRSAWRKSRGGITVEGALVLLPFCALVFSIVDLSFAMAAGSALQHAAARAGAALADSFRAGAAPASAEAAAAASAHAGMAGLGGGCLEPIQVAYWSSLQEATLGGPGSAVPGGPVPVAYARVDLVCSWRFLSPLTAELVAPFGGVRLAASSLVRVK